MVNYLGRSIYTFGTEEQKKEFLPSLLNGDRSWCQGFSEPDAGSDIGSLKTRADLHGDIYVVNGQKMWTSGGQFAEWCLLLARTDREAPKHKGISCLLVDMKSPGITVRPIVLADGDPETCEVFWDNVEVPASQMLGQPGQGWSVAMTTFAYERGPADVGHHRQLPEDHAGRRGGGGRPRGPGRSRGAQGPGPGLRPSRRAPAQRGRAAVHAGVGPPARAPRARWPSCCGPRPSRSWPTRP